MDLESHAGFMGGLEGGKKYGESAPYYATSMLEVFFHVSTRMPSSTDEERHRKVSVHCPIFRLAYVNCVLNRYRNV